MQVILLEKITHLGELGDIVKVKDGYARNYLIPTKRAKRATQAAIAEFEQRRAELEKAQAERIAAAEAIAAKLNGDVVEVASKTDASSALSRTLTSLTLFKLKVSILRRLKFVCPTARSRLWVKPRS